MAELLRVERPRPAPERVKEWAVDLTEARERYRKHVRRCRLCWAALHLTDRARRLCSQGEDYARQVEVRAHPDDVPEPREPDAPTS